MKKIFSSSIGKNKHSGFTMVELLVSMTFALMFVTAVLHTISAFGYSALYSKKNDMKFRKLAEYKLRQINILPSLEDNRKFHVNEFNISKSIKHNNPSFFIENIPTCLFKSSLVDLIYICKNSKNKVNDVFLYFTGNKKDAEAEKITYTFLYSTQLSEKPNNIFVKPIFSEKCKFPLDLKYILKGDLIGLGFISPTIGHTISKINNWNELSDKKILFNYQNLLIFQLLDDKIKKLYVYFE